MVATCISETSVEFQLVYIPEDRPQRSLREYIALFHLGRLLKEMS
jgi:hypothetical protein